MKKSNVTAVVLFLLFSIILGACNLPVFTEEDLTDDLAQTMVAMALTQTAVAEKESAEPAIIETEEIAVEEEEVEIVEEAPTPTEIAHNITPGEPGWINKYFYDTNSATTASGGYITRGDDFVANLYERPFTATDMIYRSDVDIQKTEISEDKTFYYVTIYLDDYHPEGGLGAAYGVEVDEDRDGRGDLLVIADRPASTSWDIIGVSVWKDANNDVGGSKILRPDTNYAGDSYEKEVFSLEVLDDPDTAWARASQGKPVSVTIAFKKSLISRNNFVWGVWAADALLDPALLDLHDHFTQTEAGSPYPTHSTFPLAAVNLVDNTCRETYNFEATDPIPGLCYIPEVEPSATTTATPTITITPTITLTLTPTITPTLQPGQISYAAWDDTNNNGIREPGESLTVNSIVVTLRRDSCISTGLTSTNAKSYTFTNLASGTYCVTLSSVYTQMTTPNNFTVFLPPGGSIAVAFGFYVVP